MGNNSSQKKLDKPKQIAVVHPEPRKPSAAAAPPEPETANEPEITQEIEDKPQEPSPRPIQNQNPNPIPILKPISNPLPQNQPPIQPQNTNQSQQPTSEKNQVQVQAQPRKISDNSKKSELKRRGSTGSKKEPRLHRGHWTTLDTKRIKSERNLVTCLSKSADGQTAMWIEGTPLLNGERYYLIRIFDQTAAIAFGCTERSRLAKRSKTRGLLYDGSTGELTNGVTVLVPDFGPKIKPGDEVGVLVTYSEQQQQGPSTSGPGSGPDSDLQSSKVRVYFYRNGTCLGLGYDIPTRYIPSGLHPIVQFYEAGSALITQIDPEDTIKFPRSRIRPPKKGIEGDWVVVPGTVTIDGNLFQPPSLEGVMLIVCAERKAGSNKYLVFVHVIKHTWFIVNKNEKTWKFVEGTKDVTPKHYLDQPLILSMVQGSTKGSERRVDISEDANPALLPLDRYLPGWTMNPDSVTFRGDEMTMIKDSSRITFARKRPETVIGNPFI